MFDGNLFVSLQGAWLDWRHRNGPTRSEVSQARRARGILTPWDRSGERAAFQVDALRREQGRMLREQERPRMVPCTCGDPRCNR